MLSGDDDKPATRSGQRKSKAEQQSRKGEQRNRKAANERKTKAEPSQRVQEESQNAIREQASAPAVPADNPAPPVAAATTSPAVSAEASPVNFQTVANAYGEFSRKSLEQTRSFLEKLASARSFGKALELQTEFAREAYETFVTESRRIGELHSQLAAQRLKRLEGFMARMPKPF